MGVAPTSSSPTPTRTVPSAPAFEIVTDENSVSKITRIEVAVEGADLTRDNLNLPLRGIVDAALRSPRGGCEGPDAQPGTRPEETGGLFHPR